MLTTLVLLAGILIPQQPTDFTTPSEFVIWASGLPAIYKPFIQIITVSGLSRLVSTLWLWAPLALLTLVLLVSLGEHIPGAWQRLRRKPEDKVKPGRHPLRQRQQTTSRIDAPSNPSDPASAEDTLTHLEKNLGELGFQTTRMDTPPGLQAERHVIAWAGSSLFLLSWLIILASLIICFIWGERQQVVLSTGNDASRLQLGTQTLFLDSFTPAQSTHVNLDGRLVLVDGATRLPPVQLNQPHYYRGWWLIPTNVVPVMRVSFTEQIPFPATTTDQVTLVFTDQDLTQSFVYARRNLTFEFAYQVNENEPGYSLRLVDQETPIEIDSNNNTFFLPNFNLNGQINIQHRLNLKAYYLPWAGLTGVLVGIATWVFSLLLLVGPPPILLQFSIISRGRGSHIEVDLEHGQTLTPYPPPIDSLLQLTPPTDANSES